MNEKSAEKNIVQRGNGKERPQLSAEQLALIERAIAGDTDALGELYVGYRKFIYRYCHEFLSNMGDVENAHSEVAFRMVAKIHSLKEPANFVAWLYGLTRNTCYELNRKERQVRGTDDAELGIKAIIEGRFYMDPHESLEHAEFEKAIYAAVDALPARQREIVSLFYLEQKSYVEIENELNISIGSISKNLNRARKNLAKALLGSDYENERSAAQVGFAAYFAVNLREVSMKSGTSFTAKATLLKYGKLIGTGFATLTLATAVFVATNHDKAEPESPPAVVYPADRDVHITFHSGAGDGAESTESESSTPARYNPSFAEVEGDAWQPLAYKVMKGGEPAELVASGESETIDIASLGLEPGEYTVIWQVKKQDLTVELSRTFEII